MSTSLLLMKGGSLDGVVGGDYGCFAEMLMGFGVVIEIWE